MFKIPIIDKRLTSLIYKKCGQTGKKEINSVENWAKNMATFRNIDGQYTWECNLIYDYETANQKKTNCSPFREV